MANGLGQNRKIPIFGTGIATVLKIQQKLNNLKYSKLKKCSYYILRILQKNEKRNYLWALK